MSNICRCRSFKSPSPSPWQNVIFAKFFSSLNCSYSSSSTSTFHGSVSAVDTPRSFQSYRRETFGWMPRHSHVHESRQKNRKRNISQECTSSTSDQMDCHRDKPQQNNSTFEECVSSLSSSELLLREVQSLHELLSPGNQFFCFRLCVGKYVRIQKCIITSLSFCVIIISLLIWHSFPLKILFLPFFLFLPQSIT